jgi:hypothetical protein
VRNGPDGNPAGFHPIDDELNVNERRASMGLEPLEEYAKRFGFIYRLPTHWLVLLAPYYLAIAAFGEIR